DRSVPTESLRVGQVITYRPPGRREVVTHRIVWMGRGAGGARALRTKGDANAHADPWRFELRRPTQARAAFSVPLLGWPLAAPGTKVLGMTWAGTLRRPSTLAGTEGWAARIADSGNGAAYLSCPASTGSCTYNQTAPQWLPLPSGAPGAGIQVGSYCVPAIPH